MVASFDESKEVRFAMSCGGPYIAARYVRQAADRFGRENKIFIRINGMTLGEIRDILEAGFNNRTAKVVDLEKEVLRQISRMANESGCVFPKDFIAMIGIEIGSALGVFLGVYKGYFNLDSSDLILVGSIGQKFGLNVFNNKGEELFLSNIEAGIYQNSGIGLPVIRSKMDADRAILAFCPADSVGALIQTTASSIPAADSDNLGAGYALPKERIAFGMPELLSAGSRLLNSSGISSSGFVAEDFLKGRKVFVDFSAETGPPAGHSNNPIRAQGIFLSVNLASSALFPQDSRRLYNEEVLRSNDIFLIPEGAKDLLFAQELRQLNVLKKNKALKQR